MLQTKSQSFRRDLRGWLLKALYRFPDGTGLRQAESRSRLVGILGTEQAGLRNALLRTEARNSYIIVH